MRVNCTRMEPKAGGGPVGSGTGGSSGEPAAWRPAAARASGIGDLASGGPAPHGPAGGPPQLDEVVDRTHQVELAPHRHEPAQREEAGPPAPCPAPAGGPATT